MKMYSEEIDVQCESTMLRPQSFRWQDKDYKVESILKAWQDWGFPAGSARRKNWRMRRHRNAFVVRTEEGRVFELYMDRKGPKFVWILFRELDA